MVDSTETEPFKGCPEDYILDRRTFQFVETGQISTDFSLIVDTNSKYYKDRNEEKIICLVGFGTIYLKNVGFNMVSFTIQSINITYRNGKTCEMENPQSISKYLSNNDTLEMKISYMGQLGNDLCWFNENVKNPTLEQIKKLKSEGDILNTPIDYGADEFRRLELNFITKNIFGEEYKQKIMLNVEDGFEKDQVIYRTETVFLGK